MPADTFSESGIDPTRVESDSPMFAAGPGFAGGRAASSRRSGRNMAPIAVAGGLVLLAGAAAAGWYMTQPHDQGVAMATPGAATPAAPAPAASPAPTDQLAQNTAPATPPVTPNSLSVTTKAPPPADAPRVTHRTATKRVHASSRSADASGVNASATLPAAPQPYAGSTRSSAAPVNPTPTPTTQAPADTPTPAPTQTVPPQSSPPQSATPPTTQPPPQ